ncbi:MAG: 2-hydroxychromene-2-carboxylate isomerase [Gammaproteobacteria bacterium]|nr:2-hydroxychromene-2-carboxylate isomerase [Gammaproteobacteria bacterium]
MHVDFYYDFVSPYSYLAALRVPEFAIQHQINIHWKPFLLPQLIKMSGNTPPSSVRRKALYLYRDLKRWAEHLDVPFKMQNPSFFDSRPALLGAQALNNGKRSSFSLEVFKGLWSGGVQPDHPRWLDEIMTDHKLPIEWAQPEHPDQLMAELKDSTVTAYRLGAFGAPTFLLYCGAKPELFWGVDRMDFLSHAINMAKVKKS